jgi:hypothetical protein
MYYYQQRTDKLKTALQRSCFEANKRLIRRCHKNQSERYPKLHILMMVLRSQFDLRK